MKEVKTKSKTKVSKIAQITSKIKNYFSPSPEALVAAMDSTNYYPNGKPYYDISKKIVNAKHLEPEAKMDLLMDMYGKYYLYHHKGAVDFDTYESYYEEFTYEAYGQTFKNYPVYNKRFEELSTMAKYIVNRDMRNSFQKVLGEMKTTEGRIDEYLTTATKAERTIISNSLKLLDDYHDNLKDNEYCSTGSEADIEQLLTTRYESKIKQATKESSPFPEFEPKDPVQ